MGMPPRVPARDEVITDVLLLGKQTSGYIQNDKLEVEQTCRATTDKIKPIDISTTGEMHAADYREQQDLMSGVGTLAWVVRMCRPGHCCVTSQLQSVVQKPTVKDLKTFNKAAAELRHTAQKGIHYRKGVDWHNCVIAAVADASHAGSSEFLED